MKENALGAGDHLSVTLNHSLLVLYVKKVCDCSLNRIIELLLTLLFIIQDQKQPLSPGITTSAIGFSILLLSGHSDRLILLLSIGRYRI